ncbi:MAG TPA: histidine kinase dimerization/phospho-acceptor domain-containing protein, partial [Candidatus Krumholzibacteria bacterium]|nr:histidine kinase dimerization/phospho-acceptor domain-containing protein [Candidatus Krumholzibacteria bacterium]
MSRSGGMMTQRERKEKAAPVLAVDTQAPVAADLHAEVERLRRELDELQRTDRFKDHCLSVAAHELATPLTVIQAYVETLQAKWNAPGFDQVPEFLHVLQHETARLIRTVERTLQISRLTSANQTVQRLPLQLLPLISV